MKIWSSQILSQCHMYAHVKMVYKDISQICATLQRQRLNKYEYERFYVVLKVLCRIHTLELAGLYQLHTILCYYNQTVSSREFRLVLCGYLFLLNPKSTWWTKCVYLSIVTAKLSMSIFAKLMYDQETIMIIGWVNGCFW